MARKSDTKEINKKHTSRPVGGAERTHVAMAGPRLAECGTNGGRQSDHWQTLRPHIHADKLRGLDSEWPRMGQAEWRVAPCGPTFVHR